VLLEKLMNIISKSTRDLSVLIRVMVLPDPGGPHSKNGLCSLNHPHRTSLCLKVSTVSMIRSASVTF
jgi:hypothetical protein